MPYRFALLSLALIAPAVPEVASAQQVRANDILAAQVMLDRARHSPGAIDGVMGGNTQRALAAFEKANDLPVDGRLDPDVLAKLKAQSPGSVLTSYRIEAEAVGELVSVPDGMEAQASLKHLGFETAIEALGEKFHMSQSLLRKLNPEASFTPGEMITVVTPGKDELTAEINRIEVDGTRSELRAFDASGKLVATYPATIGSDAFPSPSGSMEVRAVAPAPTYYFDPEGRTWGPDRRLTIAAGPNNPVGSTWIDLTREGYGIHGTPEPKLIGKTSSHGCVRLTNWDAEELGRAVSGGTEVHFT